MTDVETPPIVPPDEAGSEPVTSEPTRPELNVTNSAVAADWLREHIGAGLLAGMLNRGGEIVHTPREGEDGYIPPNDIDGHDGPAQIRGVTGRALAARLSYLYQCFKLNKHDERSPALFPTAAASTAIEVPDMLPNVRSLRGVTHTPLVRDDGTVLAEPGYDDATKLLYLPDPTLTLPELAAEPTRDDATAGAAAVGEMIADFTFVTEHDRTNYLGLLLTPLLRELCPPPYKLGAITAPQPGSGKTLLATVMRIIHGGVFRAEIPSEDGELRKQITAILDVTTGPVVHFDNVTGVLRSSTLAGLLTSSRWGDRLLGVNEWVTRRNDRLWILTGNNVALGGDLPRRTVFVTIDPGVPDPHLRTGFAIPDLEQWVQERRGVLLGHLLTMVRAWSLAGRPTHRATGDGYAHWGATVDGVLRFAGVAGDFDSIQTKRDVAGVDDADWRDFLAAAHEQFGDAAWTARELLDLVDTNGTALAPTVQRVPVDALPSELMDKALRSGARSCAKSLGRWLANRDGRFAGEFTVRSDGENRRGVKLWRVHVASNTRAPGLPGLPGLYPTPSREEKRTQGEKSQSERPGRNPTEPANPAEATSDRRPLNVTSNPAGGLCEVCGAPCYALTDGRSVHAACALRREAQT